MFEDDYDIIKKLYDTIHHIQRIDDNTRHMYNVVKNVCKSYNAMNENSQCKLKLSNNFKHFIARVVCEFLELLGDKINIYLQNTKCKSIKLDDISKII